MLSVKSFRAKTLKWILLSALLLTLIPVGTAQAAVNNFYNVIMQDGADPWMYKHTDGYYYFTKTTGDGVTLWRSKTISGVDAGEQKQVMSGCCGIWAPELHWINNKWYIYYAKDNGNNVNHRMYVLENSSADPFTGTWTDKGQITDSTNKWAIDGTVLNNGGNLYFLWSGWEGDTDGQQNLYIAHMSNPWTIDSARTKIATPQYSWETNTYPTVNEGPQVIVRNGTISLVYSASGSWTNGYCLGLITASTSSDLLSASSWTKRSTPIFSSANGIYGPGHHSFTKSKDGNEDWIIYHGARWDGAGWTRSVRAQKFTWNTDNTPYLGSPASPNTPITLPSGEAQHDRYEGESAFMSGGAYASSDTTASNGSKAGHIDAAGSYVEFTVQAPAAGNYVVAARTANGTSGQPMATFKLSINGGTGSTFYVVYSGWQNWTNATAKVYLNAGTNKVRFTRDTNYAEIDAIDVFPVQ
ncbi:family 43 glycosylhydrolase [Paenibacillus gansuensis]|uniref:Family 43 glycosylhydrolase n=1 Tax=Paenibacillus gansuensis TaxID=306542 RepID=A0ABW5PAM5_9BACL